MAAIDVFPGLSGYTERRTSTTLKENTVTTARKPRPPRKAMEVTTYSAWFHVRTLHDTSLEFVLDAADARRGRPTRIQLQPQGRTFTSYSEALWDMLNAEFKKSKEIRVPERQEYGDIAFSVEATSIPMLQAALVRCEKVVQRWVNKYRINSMKGI